MDSVVRRTANYKPSIWNDAYIQTLNNPYLEKKFLEQAEQLKGKVKILLEKTGDLVEQIELVDVLQRLGIYYHFTEYIDRVLKNAYVVVADDTRSQNLHFVALRFRLLRLHGYTITPEVFKNFTNENGEFKTSICNNTKGIISLYEASFLLMEGETILELAQAFASHHLQQKLKQETDQNLVDEIRHALELPFHWKMLRLETKWFINIAYERRQDMKPLLLEFAKLDFNIVQGMYQDELKELSRWHTGTHLAEKLSFARDRLVECFLWAIGITFEPHFRYCRINLAKVGLLETMIDDMYDVYGTLDELEAFTDIVTRWDIKDLDKLPEYMKICFLALFNTVNEMAYDVYRDHGFNIIPHVTRRWAELCNKYLVEAQWYYSGYKPNLNEYLNNGWVSITGPTNLTHAYLCMTMDSLKEKPLESLWKHPEIFKWTSLVCRLVDDLGTSTDELKRGDILKSIQCYMNDVGCSEEESRSYIKNLISLTWKKINRDTLMNPEYSRDFVRASVNFARISHCIYQHGDGHGIPDQESKAVILSLVIEPIPLQ